MPMMTPVIGSDVICYNCGGRGHQSRDCLDMSPKCFAYRSFGHKLFNCSVKSEPKPTSGDGQPEEASYVY